MENQQHSCFWRSKYQSEGNRKNNQIPAHDITGAEVVERQRYSYTCHSWYFGNN